MVNVRLGLILNFENCSTQNDYDKWHQPDHYIHAGLMDLMDIITTWPHEV
jgi:hypothetical protein